MGSIELADSSLLLTYRHYRRFDGNAMNKEVAPHYFAIFLVACLVQLREAVADILHSLEGQTGMLPRRYTHGGVSGTNSNAVVLTWYTLCKAGDGFLRRTKVVLF
jgi:hypothetical protein